MKRLSLFCVFFLLCMAVQAWEYSSQENSVTQSAQLRLGADFSKEWRNGIGLEVSEELRFDLYNSLCGPSFRKSYTTLAFSYEPVQYFRLDAGYMLKILGPDSTWSAAKKADANEWIRHRVFASLTASYKFTYAKLYIRERVLMEARTDSVNLLEKNRFDWQLRSRLGAVFYVPGKPVKPYLWCELINTLNAPEYQRKDGRQYISSVRTQAGVKWRVSRLSSLNFFYRFTYGYDRDINITKKKARIELTEETLFQHAIGVIYNLDW